MNRKVINIKILSRKLMLILLSCIKQKKTYVRNSKMDKIQFVLAFIIAKNEKLIKYTKIKYIERRLIPVISYAYPIDLLNG